MSVLKWEDLVLYLKIGWDSVLEYSVRLLVLFNTPLIDIAENDIGNSSLLLDALIALLDFFGADLLYLTPFQLMLGSFIPAVIVFTIYRYFKQ